MRIPVVMGAKPAAADAVLVEDGQTMPPVGYAVRISLGSRLMGHRIGCACCTLRGPAADALGRLFRDRATGQAPYFPRVVVLASEEGEAAVRAALQDDAVTAARYRLG